MEDSPQFVVSTRMSGKLRALRNAAPLAVRTRECRSPSCVVDVQQKLPAGVNEGFADHFNAGFVGCEDPAH